MTAANRVGEDDLSALLVREARARYYRANDFPSDGGYSASHVRYAVPGGHLTLPNVEARRRALPLHDLLHIATCYDTTWRGEGEIGAWELASGAYGYAAVWVLSLAAFSAGLLLAPRSLWRAFVRGSACDTLYRHDWNDEWLQLTVRELRAMLRLDRPLPRAGPIVVARFLCCSLPVVSLVVLLAWAVVAVALHAR